MNVSDRAVVDANLVVKWFVREERADQARAVVLAYNQLLAPDVLIAEVANTLLKKHRLGEVNATTAVANLLSLPGNVVLYDSLSLVERAFTIAAQYQRTAYDSLYVALALRENCQLVTGDERLCNALRQDFGDTMLWLGNVPAGV